MSRASFLVLRCHTWPYSVIGPNPALPTTESYLKIFHSCYKTALDQLLLVDTLL